ncbi:cholecystokinin receptor-like [Mytilus californianus]|uniref:cholecystokinin receptor-like n=1 Tax=Mytilus californianus TaxID=6549 RepID=UPI00224631DC|nr:cholecystokinin receptor-like [Mytilus californianus]
MDNSTIANYNLTNRTYLDFNKTLQDYNDEEALRRLAPMIYLALLMLIGIPGNVLVLIVYPIRFQKSTHRTFIIGLALSDLFVCAVTLPFEITEMRFQYTFYNMWACKFFRACNNLFALSSIFILMGLSGDRYRRVFTPLKLQMTSHHATIFIFFSVCLALVFSWPNFLISGIRHVKLGEFNITGFDCSLSDQFAKTIYPTVYGGVLFLIFIICMVSLIVIYSLIGRKLCAHIHFRRKFSNVSSSKSTSDTTLPNEQHNINTSQQYQNEVFEEKKQNSEKKLLSKQKSTNKDRKKSKKEDMASKKLTKIAFAVSLAFILSYLPHLTISLLTALKGKFLFPPGPIVSAVLPIVTRSFAINNVVNPIIYAFIDRRFRDGYRFIFKKMNCFK